MTADADATSMGREGRRGRAPFELLRFTATPVAGALVVAELEGRFSQSGRFGRQPVLVVEASEDRPRLELAPSRATLDGGRWRAAYAIPAEAYATGRFALGLRGTLLDLPAPDEPDDAQRLTALAREANLLRRKLEAAEADAAAARAEVSASAAELGAAVLAARDGALAESAERISALEHEVVEAHRTAAEDTAAARTAAATERETALAALTREHETTVAGLTERAETAEARAAEADERVRAATEAAEARAVAAEANLDEWVRSATEAAEARAVAAEANLDERVRSATEAAEARAVAAEANLDERVRAATEAAEARAVAAEAGGDQQQRRRAADAEARALAAEEGIAVLRAELAEERERAEAAVARLEALRHAAEVDDPVAADAARIADLEQQLAAATARVEALRRAAEADDDETRTLWARRPATDDPDKTQVLSAVADDDETRPFTVPEERDADSEPRGPRGGGRPEGPLVGETRGAGGGRPASASGAGDEVLEPVPPDPRPRQPAQRGLGAWIAVAALVLFAFVLLGLLLGFLA